MAVSGADTWEKLAEKTGYSPSLLKELGKSRAIDRKHLNAICMATGVPYEWFTVPDLAEAVRVGAAQLQEETPAASGVERSKLDEIFEDPRAEGADREHGGSTR